MPDLSSVAREAAEVLARAEHSHAKVRDRYDADLMMAGFSDGFTECASRLPSEEELAEGLAARLWDRDTGDVERFEKLSPAERENVIENYDARDYAKMALSLIGEKIRG